MKMTPQLPKKKSREKNQLHSRNLMTTSTSKQRPLNQTELTFSQLRRAMTTRVFPIDTTKLKRKPQTTLLRYLVLPSKLLHIKRIKQRKWKKRSPLKVSQSQRQTLSLKVSQSNWLKSKVRQKHASLHSLYLLMTDKESLNSPTMARFQLPKISSEGYRPQDRLKMSNLNKKRSLLDKATYFRLRKRHKNRMEIRPNKQ